MTLFFVSDTLTEPSVLMALVNVALSFQRRFGLGLNTLTPV